MFVVVPNTVPCVGTVSMPGKRNVSSRPRLADHHKILVQARNFAFSTFCQIHVVDTDRGELLALVERRAFFRRLEVNGSTLIVRF